ncbi:MAG: diguanylate cyclase [Actinobacteria bacterium]|nr:diguanylate cyclase [Actinomycetota bacterium]MCB8996651.1 diguanylate cyclase [Actinomycetota bacterium]HRY11046.1 diguanylate cyclase [Candidatus Nanopelagicales bacterium]
MAPEDDVFTSQPSILVVDDDPVLTMLIGGILAQTGKIHTARSGAEGLEMARDLVPDLILLDVQMPGQDGFDVISELKMDPGLRHIPVIFITGEVIPEIESHCLEAGGADYIAKPVTPRVLQARARTHLLLKQQADMLADLSYLDTMTGAINVGAFEQQLDSECSRAALYGRPVSLLLVDIDSFGAYNQTYGFAAGDDVLVAVAKAAKSAAVRPGDLVGRTSGHQFEVLLPEVGATEAARAADGIRVAVEQLGLRNSGSKSGDLVTVSIGVASAVAGTDAAALRRAAGTALAVAQGSGGNRVNVADPM